MNEVISGEVENNLGVPMRAFPFISYINDIARSTAILGH